MSHGVAVDWAAVLGGGRRVDLPTYAFQHQRFWPQAAAAPAVAGGDGAGTAGEARFWAAVEGGDLQALAQVMAEPLPVDGDRPFRELLPQLAAWRRRERDRSVTGSWRYRVTWAPVPDPDRTALSGTWLVITPAGHPDGYVRTLESRGAQVTVLPVGPGELDRAALAERLRDACGISGVAGVLSLLALDETPTPGYPAVPAGLAGTQLLIQALGDAEVGAPLWVLTCGAVAAGPGEVPGRPVQAMAWGLGRVAALEHPDRWGGLIDMPPLLDERAAGQLSVVLDERTGARLCAVLAPWRWVRRGPGRDPGCWHRGAAAGPGPAAARCPAVASRRDRAGHRRDGCDRRARGPVAGRARRAAGGADLAVRPGRAGGRRAGRGAGRRRSSPGRCRGDRV